MKWPIVLKGVWIASSVAVLIWTVVPCGQQSNWTLRGECSILAGGIMVVLTAPSGLLLMLVLSALGYGLGVFGIETGVPSLVSDSIVWLSLATVGYLQWFILLPWVITTWRSRRARGVGH